MRFYINKIQTYLLLVHAELLMSSIVTITGKQFFVWCIC